MKYKLIGENDFTFGLTQQIGKNRGVENIDALLSVSEKDCFSPFKLENMQQAVGMLKKHQHKNSKVHIIVDADCDGACSATIMYLYLKKCGFSNVTWNNHPKKIHGIFFEELKSFEFDLLIVPDAGSSDYEQIEILSSRGVDVLVIDHHEAPKYSEHAVTINPKMCDYPNKEMCGAGVVYKVCEAFDLAEMTNYAPEFLDLVALGTIADMMDTRIPETRYFCTEGLKKVKNKMFKSIIDKQKFKMGDDLTIIGVQFYIAPLINSVFRSGTKEELDKMFTGFITTELVEVDYQKRGAGLVKVLLQEDIAREIGNIKVRQDKNKGKLMGPILDIARNQSEDKIHILDVSNVEDPEMLGLIANDVAKRQQRPALILTKAKDGLLRGSARNYGKFEIDNLKSFLMPFSFESLQGHENAFGVSLKAENLDSVREEIKLATRDISVEETFYIDFIVSPKDLTKKFIREIDKMKPLWGNSFEEAYILVKGVTCSDAQINEKRTMLSWTDKNLKYVIFNPTEKQIEDLLDKSLECDIIGRVGTNEWNGTTTEQVVISDLEVKEMKEKEIWF